MPPVYDPNYFVRRAENGPERDNPLSPSQPAATPRQPAPAVHYAGTMAGQAALYRYYTQTASLDYAEMASHYPTLRNPWHFEYEAPTYVPINTLHEKIAIACANDTDFEERWANRTEGDRNHYREIARRVLKIIPVPGAEEE